MQSGGKTGIRFLNVPFKPDVDVFDQRKDIPLPLIDLFK